MYEICGVSVEVDLIPSLVFFPAILMRIRLCASRHGNLDVHHNAQSVNVASPLRDEDLRIRDNVEIVKDLRRAWTLVHV
jgi:hypothetical protein